MAKRTRATSKGKAHSFGGDWTSTKLAVLAKYLAAYATALKDKPSADHAFRKAYIDAFAGTGYGSIRRDEDISTNLLFPDLAETAPQELLDGFARLALKTQPRFDRYNFIERSADRCAQLDALKSEFPELAEESIAVPSFFDNRAGRGYRARAPMASNPHDKLLRVFAIDVLQEHSIWDQHV